MLSFPAKTIAQHLVAATSRRHSIFGRAPWGLSRPCSSSSTATAQAKAPSSAATSSENDLPSRGDASMEELVEFADRVIPVEKRSLSRGLTLDKFEKDFTIYPEYENTPEFNRIKEYTTKLEEDLDSALEKAVSAETGEPGQMPVPFLQALVKNSVAAAFVPKRFGGTAFCEKDKLMVMEKLAHADLSLYFSVNQTQTVASLLTSCGSVEQRQRFLPRIATMAQQPAICLRDEPYGESAEAEVTNVPGMGMRLNGIKTNVLNARNADIFLVFAKHLQEDGYSQRKCFIVDRRELKDDEKITVEFQHPTNGLLGCNFCTVNFNNVRISDAEVVGVGTTPNDLYNDLLISDRTYYGAAVVGHMKRLLSELTEFANTRVEGELRFSDSHPIQDAITRLSVEVYALESMVYYIGGLRDEQLYLMHDIESSITQRFAVRALRQALVTITEVTGITGSDRDYSFEKHIRDTIAAMGLAEPDLKLVRGITLPAILTYVEQNKGMIHDIRQYSFIQYLSDMGKQQEMDLPPLKHYIAEHLHPSMELSARQLEQSMARLHKCLGKLTRDEGIYLKEDYMALRDLATIMENNLAILAIIARASRSYSIGLRNCEHELTWANWFCTRAAKQSETAIREIMALDGLGAKLNPSLTFIGKSVLDGRGYYLESPLEKNW